MSALIESEGNLSAFTPTPLKELGQWSGGGTPSKSKPEYWEAGKIPWVSPKDMKTAHIVDSEDHITAEAVAGSAAKLIPAGSILIVTRSGILSHTLPVAVSKVPVTVNQDLKALTPKKGVLPEYVAWALRGFARDILNSCTKQGTTVSSIETAALHRFQIPVAPLDQQKRIVAGIEKQFSRLDEAVANLKRVKANLKRYKASVLQAVTSGILATYEGQPKNATDWRWRTIAELASLEPRSIQSGPFGSNLRHSEFQATGKLVIGIDNVRDGEFSLGSNHRISDAKFKELSKYAARPGDVLITVMATIGRVCVVPESIEPAIITKHVYRITVDRNLAVPDYIAIALRGSYEVRQQIMSSVQGQTRPGLNGDLIKKIRVPIPPLDEQHRIVAEVDRRLSLLRETESQMDASLQRAERLRQSVLSRSFAGV